VLACLIPLQLSNAHSANGTLNGQPRRQKQVNVYFYHEPGEYIDLSPVERKVSPASPARAAIEALLGGPTPEEKRRGFDSLAGASEFAIGSLKIADGSARVNFVASRTWPGWPGELAAVRFKTAVELTLKQFPNVRRVIVSLNGNQKFADAR
jgi:spore germination protein GerM